MSSLILDFFHSDGGGGQEPLNYILRLRGTNNGIVDLAGNKFNIVGSVNCYYDNNESKYYINLPGRGNYINLYQGLQDNINSLEDFTIYCRTKIASNNVAYGWKLFGNIQNRTSSIDTCALTGEATQNTGQYRYEFRHVKDGDSWVPGMISTSDWRNMGDRFHTITITRKNDICYLFTDGILEASTDFEKSSFNLTNQSFYVGAVPYSDGEYFIGQILELSIIKGTALWTENFTPPTTYLPDKI